MSDSYENTTGFDAAIEPERYELTSGPAYRFEVDRRDFFKFLGGGVIVMMTVKGALGQESGGGGRRQGGGQSLPQDIAAWLHINETGDITVFTGKVEVGQGIRTSLAQTVAEELSIPAASINRITMVMGDTDLTPFDLGTFGSRTTPTMAPQLRKVAAATRELLIDMAAERWKVDRNLVKVANGKLVKAGSKETLSFGELTKGQKLSKTISGDVAIVPATEWKVAGKSVHKVNGELFVTGKHKYTSDMKPTGTLYAKILRPESFGATLTSLDSKEAEKIPGVTVVRDGDFVGVAAPNQQAATQAVKALRAEWKSTPQPSRAELFDYLRKTANQGNGGRDAGAATGSMETGLSQAAKKVQQTYTVAYIAHAPLEPRAAVAEWKDNKLTVWTGSQRPFGVRGELAQAFHVPEENVRVIVPDTGSGYGGKHTGDAAVEAARLAKATGKPVKLVWTREEEFTWAYFRPAGVIDITSGVTADGVLTAWEFHNYNSGNSGIETMYEVPNKKIVFHPTQYPLKQGSYRGLAATANHFARETNMDELAHSLKLDPLEFRLKNLKDQRLRAVLEAAATRFGWGKSKPAPGRGFGIAGGFDKGGYVATCAEVGVDRVNGNVKLIRVVEAFECGAIVNPDLLKSQIEGGLIQGIGGALFEAIDFANGKILNPHFARYRVPRFGDIPAIEIVMLDRKDIPSAGAGETPIVGLAPAVGNAIFNATGVRLRSLPLVPNGLKEEPVSKA